MLLKRLYDPGLAQASFVIGCSATGEALVVDPNRDVEQYVRAASEEGLRVTHVTETHIHADFVSGSRELAQRTSAQLLLSDEGDENWKYDFAASAGAVLLRDGDTFTVGNLKFDVVHTPGHTPEHLSFLITDTPATDRPMGALTGDFIFAGDVGRPDLLEKAAHVAGSMDHAARTLFRSLQRFKALPEYLQLFPGHGAGSACGKALGAVPSTTLGYEKIANWGLITDDEEEFVRTVLAGQPEPPTYFAQMKRVNKRGPSILGGFTTPAKMPAAALSELCATGAIVIDTRDAARFAQGHISGAINIPLNKAFTTWAGWLVPYSRDLYLVTETGCEACIGAAVRDLALIGLDQVRGYFDDAAMSEWAATGQPMQTLPQLTPMELGARRATESSVDVIDVRTHDEWEHGHLAGVRNIPLGELPNRMGEIGRDRPVVVHCQTGARSAIAASVLQASGFPDVNNLSGGYAAWHAAGMPTEHSTE